MVSVVPVKIPNHDKDRTLTRRTVKGAAGGLKGVHYEDDRRPDPAGKIGPEAARIQKAKAEQIRQIRREAQATTRAAAGTQTTTPAPVGAPKEEQEMILDDEDATSRDTKAKQKRRAVVARDRLTIDKDAPDRRRAVRWDLLSERDGDGPDDDEGVSVDLDAIAAAVFDPHPSSWAHLFEPDVRPRPGAPGLMLPDEIQAAFPSPLDYAKHCMLLAQTFGHTTGAAHHEVVDYLVALFVGLRDHRFGRRALLSWGPDTGILNVYPLEVIERVLIAYPEFLPRLRRERWIAPELGDPPQAELTLSPDLPLSLTVPEDVMVRGFAVKAGVRPGYRFEPGPERSTYALTLSTPGRYELLMSARRPSGDTLVDGLQVRVLGPVPVASPTPFRDAERIARWPMPSLPRPAAFAAGIEEEETIDGGGGLDPHELARRRRDDAMKGPKGERADPFYGLGHDAARAPIRTGKAPAPPMPDPRLPLEVPEDVWLSAAEAAVLRLALAAGATKADVQTSGDHPSGAKEVTEVMPAWPETAVEAVYGDDPVLPSTPEQHERAIDPDGGPTRPDAPVAIGRPPGVVSGTQSEVPEESPDED